MNVLYLTLNPNRMSTTVPTEGWFRELMPRGLRPVLVSREEGEFQRWTAEFGVPCYVDPLPFPSKANPLPYLRSQWRLRRIAATHDIDLVHANEHDVYPSARGVAAGRRVPSVASVHFTVDRGFCGWAFGGRHRPRRLFFVTERSLETCRPALEGLLETERLRVLHNGIEVARYRPSGEAGAAPPISTEREDAFTVGVACALRPRKQIEHLLRAASRLPGIKVHLAGFAPPGDEDYADRLLAEAGDTLGDRFWFHGRLDDLAPFCGGLDLFVNTSREETFGIACLEAMAAGCPVVGYASKAVDEVVLPDGGEIVPQDDVAALTAAIDRWSHHDADERAARRAGAFDQAERFDIGAIARRLFEEYRAVLDASVASSAAGTPRTSGASL